MFTPQEVSEKTFPKASGFNNGYGMAAVDEFLDALTEDYTALYKDNAALKAKLKVLAEKVEEYRATEDAMRSTLLSAQRMAAQMVSDAQAQRDKMLSDAQEEANRQVAQLEQQVAQAQHKLTMAQASLSDFLRRAGELPALSAGGRGGGGPARDPARPGGGPCPRGRRCGGARRTGGGGSRRGSRGSGRRTRPAGGPGGGARQDGVPLLGGLQSGRPEVRAQL